MCLLKLFKLKAIDAVPGTMVNELKDMFSSLQHAAQLEAKHPIALLMALAFVGVHARCLTMPTQQSQYTHHEALSHDDDVEPHPAAEYTLYGKYVGQTIVMNNQSEAHDHDEVLS